MTTILIATGAFIAAFVVLAIMAMCHIHKMNDRPWDKFHVKGDDE